MGGRRDHAQFGFAWELRSFRLLDRPTLVALISALAALLVAAGIMRRGVMVGPDGWAYWEGAVSMLSGHGYTYFGGQPIQAFPPLFSVCIAAISSVLGVRGLALAATLLALTAATAFVWTYLVASLCGVGVAARPWKALAALYVAVCVAPWYQTLLADALGLVLLGGLLLPLLRTVDAGVPGTKGSWLCAPLALAGGLTALLLTRNSSVAFLPVIAGLFLFRQAGERAARRAVGAAVVFALPVTTWWLVRAALGQTRSHDVGIGAAKFTPLDYSTQLANGLADLLGHPTMGAAKWLVEIAAVAAFAWSLASLFTGVSPSRRAALALAAAALGGTAGLWLLFNLTWIDHELRSRFLWHLPLVMMGTLAVGLSASEHGRGRPLAAAVALLLLLLQTAHVGVNLLRTPEAEYPGKVTMGTVIRPDYIDAPPMPVGRHMLVSPPSFGWIDRGYGRRTHPRE